MDKKEFKRRIYVRPWAEVIKVEAESQLMAASLEVKPGGGGNISLEDLKADDDDTEIMGLEVVEFHPSNGR